MILEIVKDSLKYSFQNIKSVLIIGILILFSFLIIPLILISGYSYRVTRIGLQGMINTEMLISTDTDLKFNNFKEMLKDGLKTIAIVISYSLIPIIITTISIIFINYNFTFSNTNNDIYLNIALELFLIILITGFLALMFISVAIPHIIENKSLKSGFKIRELIKIIKAVGIREYISYNIASIVVLISMSIVLFLLIAILTSILNLILLSTTHIVPNWDVMGINYDLILYGLLLILIIYPIYIIFQSRGIALIYETSETHEAFENE